ncbi:AMP-binding protein [Gordonia rhizosphera]|uniref:Putative acid--CoA ligase n=1 Tax=Gordonia rhizosphera NBRC 16068 TaxID=1108045 RepID=K6WKG5_9ACTN|nr:AMP-binding protein [Gordonia rhizosphera]GAB92652.1 putative acid--CoA ligase [Gordonia rhizosphera NBRC 16068]
MSAMSRRVRSYAWLVRVLTRGGVIGPTRPDRIVRMGRAMKRQGGASPMSGIGLAAARKPDATALVDEAGSLTWGDLDRRGDALAVGIASLTGRPVRTIAVLCRNHRGIIEALTAGTRLGAETVLLNTGFAGPQLADVIGQESVDLLIVDDEFGELVEVAVAANPSLRCLRAWTEPDTVAMSPARRSADVGTIDEFIVAHRGDHPAPVTRAGRIVLLTSGTTGTPKGARRGGSTDVASLAAVLDRIPWRGGQSTVIAAPVFHAWGFGQVAIAAAVTSTMIMQRRFDPVGTLDLVRRYGATGLAVVPVMLERIMDLPPAELDARPMPTLRFVTASGSRMRTDALIAFMDRFGDIVYNSYNATEAGLISTAVPVDLRAAPETAGRPLTGTRVRLLDDDGREVPAGGTGRIVVASNSGFDGYTSADTTKEYADGYMISGDVGRCDTAGRLFVVGRDDEMIVSGGENVFPLEVEQVLDAHPAILESAVVGVDDERFGQRLVAYAVTRPDAVITAEELQAHIKSELAGYKVPREIHFLPQLPRNATGKVLKKSLPETVSTHAAGNPEQEP